MSPSPRPLSRKTAPSAPAGRKKRARRQVPVLPMPDLLWNATPEPDVVTIPARRVLALGGAGAPESELFQRAFGALYGVAFTLKFARKAESAARDFKIGPLEGRWSADLVAGQTVKPPRESWLWELRIAVPDDVTAADVTAAIRAATTRKGGKLEGSADAARVRLLRLPAQRVGRALHVGPYADEGRTLARIDEAVEAAGLVPAFSHVEVYLNDPRRTRPERLETVLVRELLDR